MAYGPDQGFAWVIALACFFINFIMAGLARTAGVLYVAIIDLYGVSREAATTPFSLRVCIRNMTGPLIGLLGQKYGIRVLSAVGSLIAALGSILCYFAPNVLWITIFWGLIHGFGFGLSTILHMMTINQYFDKYKASALGLGYSGDCFGSFAFPILMEYLFATYGVRGSFLIIGGIVLNTLPLALLLRKPPWLKDASKPKKSRNSLKKISNHFKKHAVTNYQRCEMNKKLSKLQSQLGRLKTVNEIESFENTKSDDIKLETNIAVTKQFSTFDDEHRGEINKAFTSSENNLSSLNSGNMAKNVSNLKPQNSIPSSEKKHLAVPPRNTFGPSTSRGFSCCDIHCSNSGLCDSKCWKKTEDLRVCSEIKTSKSATDLKSNNQPFPEHVNRSLRLSKAHHLNLVDRRDSMPSILERETSANVKFDNNSIPEDEITKEVEPPRIDENAMLRKRRRSSFVEVAQDFVNRVRTASFASSVAQDAFFTPMPQESESDSEEELDCELKSVVEHKNHDIDNCGHRDLVLTVDRTMMEEYFQEILEEPEEKVVEQKIKPPSVFKIMLRTNMKPMFILISISMAVYVFLFCSVSTIIIDYASDLGVPLDKGKYLIIGFSVADLIGRLSFGQIIDRNMMKMKNFSGATMLLMGALVAVIPLNVSFNYMMVCMCMYGLVQGGTAIMFPILINTYMDRNSESVAMGCVNLYGGLLMLLMAPMIGFFRDKTGSYNYVFYIIGGIVALVGIVWQFEPMIVKFQNRKFREKYIMRRELSVADFQR